MPTPFKIIIVDDGFIGKYVERELSAHPVRVGQTAELMSPADYATVAVADAVIDTTGAVTGFPAGCLSISVAANPCSAARLRLSLPAVVGTGMRGQLMDMARGINAGWYFNIGGDRSRMSVIHAVSVATAVRLAVKSGDYAGDWLLTDGLDPLRSDVAAALACRLGQKRIYTMPMKWHKILARLGDKLRFMPYSTARLNAMTRDAIKAGLTFADVCPDWHPVDTVDYLKTHDYSDETF